MSHSSTRDADATTIEDGKARDRSVDVVHGRGLDTSIRSVLQG